MDPKYHMNQMKRSSCITRQMEDITSSCARSTDKIVQFIHFQQSVMRQLAQSKVPKSNIRQFIC